jgi:hypothetical protein
MVRPLRYTDHILENYSRRIGDRRTIFFIWRAANRTTPALSRPPANLRGIAIEVYGSRLSISSLVNRMVIII